MNIKKPLLIVFEGIDGSGKTTVSRMLLEHLNEKGIKTVWFREPGDSKWGKKIRELAHLKDSIPVDEELQYFIEDRKINVKENILPALGENKWVIVDRFYLSGACYQGARGLNLQEIIDRNREFAPEPDVTFLVDLDVQTALTRIKKGRDVEAKLFEQKEFLQKVRENYLKVASSSPIYDPSHSDYTARFPVDCKKIVTIDGSPAPETIISEFIMPILLQTKLE
ncbi:MAG: dTMP kinase [bacterium]|nr:dTMP kinase [bacterium]